MQVSLILYAEHEFNATTFTARVIAGTGSDIYSCIAGAIGALKGPKHGGANEVALEIQLRYTTPDEAEADIRRRVANAKSSSASAIPSTPSAIPATTSIKKVARGPPVTAGDMALYAIAERIENVMRDTKKMFPNLDWYSRRRLSRMGIPIAIFTPLSPSPAPPAGPHTSSNNASDGKIIRPSAVYTGPENLKFVPLAERP